MTPYKALFGWKIKVWLTDLNLPKEVIENITNEEE